jgi:hypothetical protein
MSIYQERPSHCIDAGLVEMTIPRKSRSSKREYRLTQKGKEGGSKNGGKELEVPENVNISRTSLLQGGKEEIGKDDQRR